MSTARVDTCKNMYKYTFKSTTDLAEKLAQDRQMKQLGDGKGHPLWYLGHLAMSTDVIVNQWLLGGESVIPPDYLPKFAPTIMGGGPVSSDASDYPSWDEAFENYKKATAKTIELLDGLSDEELDGAPKGNLPEEARSFFADLGGSLIGMAAHDSHHRGQIAQISALE